MSELVFGGIPSKYASLDASKVVIQPIPYDGTSTYGKGADKGFDAFIKASENLELYDIETETEVYQEGIHVLPPILENKWPESMTDVVYVKTKEILKGDKFPTFFGGEHSISIGVIKAFHEKYSNLTVLQLDAHSDLRESYNGSKYNHACAMHKASKLGNLVQVGIRSMDVSEREFMNVDNCYFAKDIYSSNDWFESALSNCTHDVYISIDLDVFDPSIMPSTGTPEPGGLHWYQVIKFLKLVFQKKNVVGFDIVELAPIEGVTHPDFLVAKLFYKLLSYKFKYDGKGTN